MKRLLIIAALAATLAVPFLLRPRRPAERRADDTLVIVSPHNGAIRSEFAAGFEAWHRARTGRSVAIDWRIVGGTNDITRFLEAQYDGAFREYWTGRLGRPWNAAVEAGFQTGAPPAGAPAEARAAFLASDVGCGIDLFFGGGPYDFARQAAAGRLVDSGLRQRHPDWFTPAVFPQAFRGNPYRDAHDLWFGDTLSSFGIVFNRQALRHRGIDRDPTQWTDLTDPRLVGAVALCDPTKSGTMASAFENVIQQQMQQRLEALGETRAVREGWIAGLRVVQELGANARYFTDGSQKILIDVGDGNCAAGMCIDFYASEQAEAVERRGGGDRLGFIAPAGGTTYSADPIALLRGAPHRAVAADFIEYVLSLDGQKLWDFRPGSPGGPRQYPLNLVPIRRDFYDRADWRAQRMDPGINPYGPGNTFVYRPAWTAALFQEMALISRVMCEDTHDELVAAWRAILAAPEPRRTQALAVLQDLTLVNYDRAGHEIRRAFESKDKVEEVRLARDLGEAFRRQYARAKELARGVTAPP